MKPASFQLIPGGYLDSLDPGVWGWLDKSVENGQQGLLTGMQSAVRFPRE